jgi:hypothetical protein
MQDSICEACPKTNERIFMAKLWYRTMDVARTRPRTEPYRSRRCGAQGLIARSSTAAKEVDRQLLHQLYVQPSKCAHQIGIAAACMARFDFISSDSNCPQSLLSTIWNMFVGELVPS